MTTTPKEIFLKDYQEPNYWMESIFLEFDILSDRTYVTTTTKFNKNSKQKDNSLELSGSGLNLVDISVNNKKVNESEYQVTADQLSLKDLPDSFELITKVEVNPYENFSGEGLYQSGHILCTQCEAEGFRRITYALDRPDVMASYQVKIIADKKQYPFLLANGNKIKSGDLAENRHFVVWDDPFKKPAYLFALVAGDLAKVSDTFTTRSGRKVDLEIFVDPGNEDKCEHAMVSLKNSMKWDEDKYGLEYDLDIYMIVAVDSFNMGAMENKGLNIFNSSYVLAKKDTATDADYEGIEGVIGHEYFHNWTGNRVTCRDWFQLTLKEGLTVFRDQEFSSDMLSRSVKRISDVKGLRNFQFPEDNGPLSHPIKPKSFVEINNFYTATVYEKGAEVIRMIHTLLGEEGFRKGMDLYFKRHDGQAVTTDDFIAAMADANDFNFDHFKVWYDQSGTPVINVDTEYNEKDQIFKIHLEQNVKTNNQNFDHLFLPLYMSLYSAQGEKIKIKEDGKYLFNSKKHTLEFENISSMPIVSLNENFSAPINLSLDYTQAELGTLMAYCDDTFNRYNASQKLIELEIKNLTKQLKDNDEPQLSNVFLANYQKLLLDNNIDNAFKAMALDIPELKALNDKSAVFDFDYLPKAIEILKQGIAKQLHDDLHNIVVSLGNKSEFVFNAQAMGQRSFKNYALDMLFYSNTPSSLDLIYAHYQAATNMTDEFSSLKILAKRENPYREKSLNAFYEKWKHETLIMQKWLSIQARAYDTDVKKMEALEKLDIYDAKIPNLLRSLVRTYSYFNMTNFNDINGNSYQFYIKRILDTDKLNPQIAAGLAKGLNYLRKLDAKRAGKLKECLEQLKNSPGISSDLMEVVTKNLS